MRCFLFFFTFALFTFTSPLQAYAQDMDAFYQACHTRGKSQSFCECGLKAASDQMRQSDARKVPGMKVNFGTYTASLVSDPAIDMKKLDAVCDLYDEAHEYDLQAGYASRESEPEKRKKFTDKKLATLEKQKELVMSYKATHTTNGALLQGRYCEDRNTMAQIEKDLAEGEDVIYPRLRRSLMANPIYPLTVVLRAGVKEGCGD